MTERDCLDSALLAEVFDALDELEGRANRAGAEGTEGLVELVMELRRKIIAAGARTGVYTAAHLRAVLDTAADGIVIIDHRGTIETFNPAAERMFGYAAEEVLGKSVNMLMPAPHCDEHDEYLSRYLRTRQAKVLGIGREVEGKRKDGTTFRLHLALSEVRQGDRHTFTAILSPHPAGTAQPREASSPSRESPVRNGVFT